MTETPPASSTPEPPATTASTVSPARQRVRRRRLLRRAGGLGLELFVVFAGVYAAFLLSQYQERQREEGRREAVYQALLTDVKRTASQIEFYRAVLQESWIEPIAEPYERGEQPEISNLWLPTPPLSGVWESVLESSVDLLDPAFIAQVEAQRADVQFMLDQANVTIRRNNDHIAPALGDADFYGPDGRLRPQYEWYARFLRYLEGNANFAAASTDSLRQEIGRRLAE